MEDDHGIVWLGRLEDRDLELDNALGEWTYTALGYSAHARDVPASSAVTVAAGTLIENAISYIRDLLCAFQWAWSEFGGDALFISTGRALEADTEVLQAHETAQDAFGLLCAFGDSEDRALAWHVWTETASYGLPLLQLTRRPERPAYTIALQDGVQAQLRWSLQRLYNQLFVRYGDGPDEFYEANDWVAQGLAPEGHADPDLIRMIAGVTTWRYVRQKTLTIPGLGSVEDARHIAETVLAQTSRIRATSDRIVVPGSADILDDRGQPVAPWRVRAGEIVRIRDLVPTSGEGGEHDFLIVGTSWDHDARVLTLTPESQEGNLNLIGRYARQQRLT